jgi:hypothetical protein
MKKLIFATALYGVVWFFFIREGEVTLRPGVMVKEEPRQEILHDAEPFQYKGFLITPLARFDIKAKILSKESYSLGRESDLSPIDLALGWGNMSDESVLETIRISQSNRFFYWHVDEFPIPRKEIETHASNMHIIPADDRTESALKRARKGEAGKVGGSAAQSGGGQYDHGRCAKLSRHCFLSRAFRCMCIDYVDGAYYGPFG